MRIAIDTQSTLGRKTGIGIYTNELLAAMRRIAPQHDYIDLNWGRDIPMRLDRRLRWQQWEVTQRARRAHADLLHVPGFDAPWRRPCPTVLTVHDLIGMLFPANLPAVARFYWSRWLPYSVRFADAIIADSVATRQDIVRLLHIPESTITVIPLGVGNQFQPQSQERIEALRSRYGLAQPFVLYVGTLEPRKGIDTLIDAVARMASTHRHDLVLAGKKGWYWQSILARIAKHGLETRVHTLDYVPDDDLPALYSSADVFAFPSRYEGFGLPVLEAMACGAPVVCADASSLPEVAGTAALMAPPDDVEALAANIDRIRSDPALASDLRQRGLARAQSFTWDRTARATLDVYRQLQSGSHDA